MFSLLLKELIFFIIIIYSANVQCKHLFIYFYFLFIFKQINAKITEQIHKANSFKTLDSFDNVIYTLGKKFSITYVFTWVYLQTTICLASVES